MLSASDSTATSVAKLLLGVHPLAVGHELQTKKVGSQLTYVKSWLKLQSLVPFWSIKKCV